MSSISAFVPLPALPTNSQLATKLLLEFLLDDLWPLTLKLKNKITVLINSNERGCKELHGVKDVFSLCCSQIKKCALHLLEIFQIEHREHILLQDSRDCTLERLRWCLDKLNSVQNSLEQIPQVTEEIINQSIVKSEPEDENNASQSSILSAPMYFVNWIDHALELLTNLSTIVYRTDYKESTELLDTWTNEVIDSVSGLHTSVDELLLSAMTLCRYCLPSDQPVLTARCQVVLRETKKLISEIIAGNIDTAYKVTKDTLKFPLKPTNINVLIDVLKDTLYVLETNTNTALLQLLVHCFTRPLALLKDLEEHFRESNGGGACSCKGIDNVDDCLIVKRFDFYNERLIQIGGFSISCSSDENRILTLKSGLASLEALEPHLVPAAMLAPDSHHTRFLAGAWRKEVMQIRTSIFLIVDPAAFSEKAKETMNKKLLELIRGKVYLNPDACEVIDIGEIVLDFLAIYKSQEPEALVQQERLEPLLGYLTKALKECKTVSNLLSTDSKDFLYDIGKIKKTDKEVSFDKMIQRLKLLFTIVSRINALFHFEDENSFAFNDECEDVGPNNLTHTIHKEKQTIMQTQRRHVGDNLSKNAFGRELSIQQYSPSNCIISKISKHFNAKTAQQDLSFSVQLDDLFNGISQYTESKPNKDDVGAVSRTEDKSRTFMANKHFKTVKNTSILYNFAANSNRESLRKVMLRKQYKSLAGTSLVSPQPQTYSNRNDEYEVDMSKDSTTQLQITEILDQLSNFSKPINIEPQDGCKKTIVNINGDSTFVSDNPNSVNVLTLSINGHQEEIKNILSIPVNSLDMDETRPSEFSVSWSTQSNVTTLERLSDIDLLEDKLNQLKSSNV